MKMNRRNALLGLGAIATGGGALFGSGAFSQVQADRSVSVQLADDASALLQLEPVNTTVASTSNGTLELDFSGGASGVNYDAVTDFTSVFRITNNGDSSVSIYLNQGAAAPGDLLIDTSNYQFFYDASGDGTLQTASEPTFQFYGQTSIPGTNDSSNGIVGSGSSNLTLDADGGANDSQEISVRLDTTGVDSSIINAGNELLGEVTINAV